MHLYAVLLLLAPPPQQAAPAAAQAEHVAIQASDIDRSATFYHEAFGLRLIPTPLKNRRWLDLGHGMALHILDGRTTPKPSNRDEHLALHVDDLARVTAWLDAHHLPWTNFTGEPRKMQLRFDGVRQIYVQDPDGYWLEVGDSRGVPAG
ncbi:catechol 2,3-dioxygenase-like lactoylglutathione lyase family enzyme [Sphingomonas trueperi]|uniref:VOC family protein n=1 Tax=Sphingomonas trueperi TaxID=53317 RepID=UPI003390ACC1